MVRVINENKFLKEDSGQASTLPMLLKCLNGIKKDNLRYTKMIGKDIFDIDRNDKDIEKAMDYNYGELYRELYMDRYYVYMFSRNHKMGLCTVGDVDDLIEQLSIKQGVNCYRNVFGLVLVAYNGAKTENLYLIPISKGLYNYMSKTIDESDFDEDSTIKAMLSDFAYNESYDR